MINREILNYKIEKVIGEGGMGTVYKASHTKIPNRIAAIKVLKSNFLQNENLKNRFRREMEIMATISHENIIKLEQFDVEQPDDSLFGHGLLNNLKSKFIELNN